jgi:hypothetical protein
MTTDRQDDRPKEAAPSEEAMPPAYHYIILPPNLPEEYVHLLRDPDYAPSAALVRAGHDAGWLTSAELEAGISTLHLAPTEMTEEQRATRRAINQLLLAWLSTIPGLREAAQALGGGQP